MFYPYEEHIGLWGLTELCICMCVLIGGKPIALICISSLVLGGVKLASNEDLVALEPVLACLSCMKFGIFHLTQQRSESDMSCTIDSVCISILLIVYALKFLMQVRRLMPRVSQQKLNLWMPHQMVQQLKNEGVFNFGVFI